MLMKPSRLPKFQTFEEFVNYFRKPIACILFLLVLVLIGVKGASWVVTHSTLLGILGAIVYWGRL